MLFRILFFIFGGWAKYKKTKREWTTSVCADCGCEQQKGTRFCKQCGGEELVSVGESNRIRQDLRKAEIKDLNARCRRNQAKSRIRQVADFPFCDQCNIYFENAAQFCTQCGARAGREMPPTYAYQIVQREYPDLIADEEAFETLRREPIESGVQRKALKLIGTQFVDEISNPAKRPWRTFILWSIIIAIAVIIFIVAMHIDSTSPHDQDTSY
jgi:hypothetical protein